MERLYDMKQKEIINVNDGIRFGFISDLEIDEENGKVDKIIVSARGKMLGIFGHEQEYQIPWDTVTKIGDDIILVDVDSKEILSDAE